MTVLRGSLLANAAMGLATVMTVASPVVSVAPVLAQDLVARPVVQPLPDPAASRLTEVLRALAREPQSLPLLLDAAEASLKLGDLSAAQGFYQRAEAVSPGDDRIKAGQAVMLVRQDKPLDALSLFAEAERANVPMAAYAADRGLAYDLVGDNVAAQQQYRMAQGSGGNADNDVTMRLALSQAIAGDRAGSEATLLPLLQRSDLAAYRTRAFALAIGGKEEEAVTIAQTMLPERISGRMAPYLRFMPRLTRAQQAAAANLGKFPRADAIGTDDPAIAAYTASRPALAGAQMAAAVPAGGADARLVPSGAPLGPVTAAASTVASTAAASPAPASTASSRTRERPGTRASSAQATAPVRIIQPTPIPQSPAPATVATAAAAPMPAPVAMPSPVPSPSAAQVAAVRIAAATPAAATALAERPAIAPATGPVATPASGALAGPAPGSSAMPVPATVPAPVQSAVVVVAALPDTPPPAPSPAVEAPGSRSAAPPPRDLALAFADFDEPAQVVVAAGAVDISRIQVRRETPPPKPEPAKPAPPPKPVHPSRHWVQIATGRDTGGLAFDWRRMTRTAGGLLDKYKPQIAKWGQTNRLLAGPFATAREADQFVARLKDKQLDSFRFTSDEGQEVKPLP